MAAPRFYLQESGLRTGPHSLLVLKHKAEIHVIAPDTSLASEDEPDRWFPISDSEVLRDELFPHRASYALAAAPPVARVNSPAETAAPTVDDLLRGNLVRQCAAEGELLKPLPPRSNRRLKDYLSTVALGAALSLLPWLFIPLTVGLILLSLAATLFIAACAAWVFFFVMDRY